MVRESTRICDRLSRNVSRCKTLPKLVIVALISSRSLLSFEKVLVRCTRLPRCREVTSLRRSKSFSSDKAACASCSCIGNRMVFWRFLVSAGFCIGCWVCIGMRMAITPIILISSIQVLIIFMPIAWTGSGVTEYD